ncbi:MAG: RNA 2',3'-cyclic phosphodiesterase [Solirubrobacteraceae bacterium]
MRLADSSRVRLFVALDLPAATRAVLAGSAADGALAASAADGALSAAGETGGVPVPPVRRLSVDSLHVTLCFLGACAADQVPSIAAACRFAEASAEIQLDLGAPLWLPRRHPRTVAVTLVDEDGRLAQLQGALAQALVGGGWYEPERRPYLAHVTVARIARPRRERPPALAAAPSHRFAAASFSLYRSHTGPAGARYEPLETFTLRG